MSLRPIRIGAQRSGRVSFRPRAWAEADTVKNPRNGLHRLNRLPRLATSAHRGLVVAWIYRFGPGLISSSIRTAANVPSFGIAPPMHTGNHHNPIAFCL